MMYTTHTFDLPGGGGIDLFDNAGDEEHVLKFLRTAQRHFMPSKKSLEAAVQGFTRDNRGSLKTFVLDVMVCPSEDMPDLYAYNPPFLHLSAAFQEGDSPTVISLESNDGWIDRRRNAILQAAEMTYDENMAMMYDAYPDGPPTDAEDPDDAWEDFEGEEEEI